MSTITEIIVDRKSTKRYIRDVDRQSTKSQKGGKNMNNDLLRKVIQDRGVKVSVLADKMGISRQSLHLKLNGDRSFDQGEIMAIKTNLRLSDKEFMSIFFSESVDKLSQEVAK